MARSIIIDGAQRIACPKCNQGFPLAEGVSLHILARCVEQLEAARREAADLRRQLEKHEAEKMASFGLEGA
jgi:hypothetical protein